MTGRNYNVSSKRLQGTNPTYKLLISLLCISAPIDLRLFHARVEITVEDVLTYEKSDATADKRNTISRDYRYSIDRRRAIVSSIVRACTKLCIVEPRNSRTTMRAPV